MRDLLRTAARRQEVKDALVATSIGQGLIDRYVAGEDVDDVLPVLEDLIWKGLLVNVWRVGEPASDRDAAAVVSDDYQRLLRVLAGYRLTEQTSISLRLPTIGQWIAGMGPAVALEFATEVVASAASVGVGVTIDASSSEWVDATLEVYQRLARSFDRVGVTVAANLRRTESDVIALARPGALIRLVKGAQRPANGDGFTRRTDINRSYVRCLRALMQSQAYPMIATHDARMIAISEAVAKRVGRNPDQFEYEMMLGVRPSEQRRLADIGRRIRVTVPYGPAWYPYFMRQFADTRGTLQFFLRSLVSRS